MGEVVITNQTRKPFKEKTKEDFLDQAEYLIKAGYINEPIEVYELAKRIYKAELEEYKKEQWNITQSQPQS